VSCEVYEEVSGVRKAGPIIAGVAFFAVVLVLLFVASRGFPGTYINKESQSLGPFGGNKQETIAITFHRNGTFHGYDDIAGKWELKGEDLTLHLETTMMKGNSYTGKVRRDKIYFDQAPNFIGPFGVTFTKRTPF
jgi:hypothetical protein